MMLKDIATLVALCKRRGFVFQSSEIYGGMGACYDYGPLGVLLKNNIKQLWWRSMLTRPDVEGLDCSILMSAKVWEASGHVENFTDPLMDCKACKARFREDDWASASKKCPQCGSTNVTDPRPFNLMFETHVGPVKEQSSQIYLRPETAQGIYINFLNVMQTRRQKLPFGIAQVGKAFRNEITARNFLFRMVEFEQMEMQFFVSPDDATDWFAYWLLERSQWYRDVLEIGHLIQPTPTATDQLAHYAKQATDIRFPFPFGTEEIEGIHHRGNYDLTRHMEYAKKDLSVFEEESRKKNVPYVIETSCGVDRLFLAVLSACYREDELSGEARTYFAFPYALAPFQVYVFSLVRKSPLVEVTDQIVEQLRKEGVWVQRDESGSIGRRYRRADEIGVPLCITVDYDSINDQQVTIRDRDTARQIRVPISQLNASFLAQTYHEFRVGVGKD